MAALSRYAEAVVGRESGEEGEHGKRVVEIAQSVNKSRIALGNKMVEGVRGAAGCKAIGRGKVALAPEALYLAVEGTDEAEALEQGLVQKELHVLRMIVRLLLPFWLPLWLPWVHPLQHAQPPEVA